MTLNWQFLGDLAERAFKTFVQAAASAAVIAAVASRGEFSATWWASLLTGVLGAGFSAVTSLLSSMTGDHSTASILPYIWSTFTGGSSGLSMIESVGQRIANDLHVHVHIDGKTVSSSSPIPDGAVSADAIVTLPDPDPDPDPAGAVVAVDPAVGASPSVDTGGGV